MRLPLESGNAPCVLASPVPLFRPIKLFETRKTSSASGDFRISDDAPVSEFPATMLLKMLIGDESVKMPPPRLIDELFPVIVL